MRFGFHFLDFTMPGEPESLAGLLRNSAQTAEQSGASWFSVMDHYFQMEHFQTAHDPMLEGYTTLGFLAGITERVKLGTVVTGVTYRHPGLLSKIVTTLDVLSEGRAFLGIGAAWYEREHLALGVPYPPLAERFERLEETLQIALQMWSDDEGPFEGKHFQLAETISVPAPVQSPHPPIVIGGSGEKKTLRMVAQYADACNIFGDDPEAIAHKLEVLRGHCDTLGTDYDAIEKTMIVGTDPTEDVDGFLRSMEPFAELGISMITVGPAGDDPVAWTTTMCEDLVPRLAEL